jgi:hypothetical protein
MGWSSAKGWNNAGWNTPAVTVGGTTWDPAALGSGLALSGGNLTATYTGASSNNAGRANVSHSTGKFYWEFAWITSGAQAAAVMGFGTSAASPLSGYQIGISDSNSYGWTPNGNVYFNGALATTVPGAPPTHTGCIALDIGGGLVWFRADAASWNGSGTADPATGVGGLSISALGVPLFPMFNTAANADQLTVNFGASAFVQTPPAGFGNW